MISSVKLNKVILRSLSAKANLAASCPHKPANGTHGKQNSFAKPFEKISVASKYSLIRGFLPGGEFFGKNLDEFYKLTQLKYGDVCIYPGMFGRKDVLMTFNPDDFAMLFRTEGVWPLRDGLDTLTYHRKVRCADLFGSGGLVVEQGELWARVRSTVNPVMLQPNVVKDYIPPTDVVAKELIDLIRNKRDSITLEVDKDFRYVLNNWGLESIALIALDTRLGCLDEKNRSADTDVLINGMHSFFELSYELDIKPSIWRYIATPKFNKLMNILDGVTAVAIKYIDQAKQRMKQQAPKEQDEMSVLEKLIKIDKKVAYVMAMDMLFGGIDTTSTALTSILLCLAKNLDKQELLREEIRKISNDSLTAKDLTNLPYLRACIKESLRVYPVVSVNSRTTGQDIELSGYKVPKGVTVALPNHVLMHDEKYFKNPKEFIPERWIKGSEHFKGNSDPFVYLPFGFGPRSCIGKRLSNMELEVVLINIFRNFKLEFNHSTDNAFKSHTVNVPNIPLKFKFTDL